MTRSEALVLGGLAGRDPARPLLTAYAGRSGERVELSAAAFDNAVAKCAGLLRDELDVEEGDRVLVALGSHWRALVVTGAAWCVGAWVQVVPPVSLRDEAAALAVTDAAALFIEDTADPSLARPGAARELAVVASGGLALGLSRPDEWPASAVDVVARMRAHPDRFQAASSLPGDLPAVLMTDGVCSRADLHPLAHETAEALGVTAGDRVLSTEEWHDGRSLLHAALAPLSVGASLVSAPSVGTGELAAVAAAERATVALGRPVPGLRHVPVDGHRTGS